MTAVSDIETGSVAEEGHVEPAPVVAEHPVESAPAEAVPVDPLTAPMPADIATSFQSFAATLRPRAIRDPRTGRAIGLTAGQPDEVWLKWIGRMHGMEKHTLVGWQALIDGYRKQAA